MTGRAWFPALVWTATVVELVAAAVVRPEGFDGFGWTVRSVV